MTTSKKLVLAGSFMLLLSASLTRDLRPSAARGSGGKVSRQYANLPLSFEANAGQTGAPVQFLSRGRGYTLFLTSTEAVLKLHPSKSGDLRGPRAAAARSRSVSMKLVGGNPAPAATGREELPGKSNYFIGNDPGQWRTNVPTYARVEYRNVYPGVDLVYYGNGRQLEHDFIVNPGASPQTIGLSFPDAGQLSLNARGDLLIDSGGEQVVLQAPVVYQQYGADKHTVAGRYVLRAGGASGASALGAGSSGANQVGFAVDAYDERAPLVIDPVLVYSTYVGGSNEDFGTDIAVDASGSAYVVGQTASTDFPVSGTAVQKSLAISPGNYDAFIYKLTPDGSALAYSTYLGGAGGTTGTEGIGIVVDNSGNAYITGDTDAAYPTTAGAFQTVNKGGGGDAFVTKLNSSGSALVYSTLLGGGSFDIAYSIAVDAAGEAYVTGETFSGDYPVTSGNLVKYVGGSDGFVTKVNGTGTGLVFSTYMGSKASGIGDTQGRGIAVDAAGSAYIGGQTTSTDFLTTAGAFQTAYAGGPYDAILFKLTSTGALVYSSLVGGAGFDQGRAVALDAAGNVYMTGQTFSSDFPITPGAFQSTIGGGGGGLCAAASAPQGCADAFLIKMNASGTALIFSTFMGGGGEDQGDHGCGTDSQGNVYITGFTHSVDFPLGPNPIQSVYNGGGYDAFVAKFTPTGSLVYSTYLGGIFTDSGRALAVQSPGIVYVMGYTNSTNFPTTPGAMQRVNASLSPAGFDSFVSKITDIPAAPAPAAVVSLSAASLSFGNQPVATASAARLVILSNTGNAPLNISGIALTGDFAQTNTCAAPLAPGATCAISITFTPAAAGARAGAITITGNDAGSPHGVTLTGTGTAPPAAVVSLTASALTFGSQQINTASAAQTVTLANTGTAPLSIASIAATGDFARTTTCAATLAPGASCAISITFTPTVVGARTGAVIITDNAAGSPHGVTLTGTGTAPPAAVASLSAASVAFGSQQINLTGTPRTVTLSNTGNAALTITGIAATGDFARTTTCAASLAAGASCAIGITFTPTALGPRSGAVTITDNSAGTPHIITLTGTGTAPPAAAASLSAASVAFGSQQINTSSAAQSVTLSNTGTAPLSISGIAVTGDFRTTTCAASLAPGASCAIGITFTPTAAGARSGAVTITDNAAGSPHAITLTGSGTAAPPPPPVAPSGTTTTASLSRTSVVFAIQKIGSGGPSQSITLTNTGAAALTVTGIAVTGEYTQTNNCAAVAPQGSCTITVSFRPAAIGSRPGSLSITSNATSPQQATLSGYAVR